MRWSEPSINANVDKQVPEHEYARGCVCVCVSVCVCVDVGFMYALVYVHPHLRACAFVRVCSSQYVCAKAYCKRSSKVLELHATPAMLHRGQVSDRLGRRAYDAMGDC